LLAKLSNQENKENFVCEMFNLIAPRYDLMNTFMTLGQDKAWRGFAVEHSGLRAAGYGLDICCGTGMLTMEQARLAGPTGRIVGLDFAENMLAIAMRNIKSFEFKDNIRLIQGNAMQLPFKNNTFDCVTVGWGLKNIPDIWATVQEMARVVKPGGKVVSLDMGQPSAPIFKELYWLCFERIIPTMGWIWGRNKGAYKYLYDSSRLFLPPTELINIFSHAGLTETTVHHLFKGVIAIVEGRKHDQSS
jgi:demethylmenaquinone methyltransferase / 2-methoxy-6-polyprenyl-1,4-benzoquinol methylase